jgi:hypothetical protein
VWLIKLDLLIVLSPAQDEGSELLCDENTGVPVSTILPHHAPSRAASSEWRPVGSYGWRVSSSEDLQEMITWVVGPLLLLVP